MEKEDSPREKSHSPYSIPETQKKEEKKEEKKHSLFFQLPACLPHMIVLTNVSGRVGLA